MKTEGKPGLRSSNAPGVRAQGLPWHVIPLSDQNRVYRTPIVTILIIAICVWVYFAVQPPAHLAGVTETRAQHQLRDLEFSVGHAAVPCEVTRDRALTAQEFNAVFVQQTTNLCSPHPVGPSAVEHKHVYAAMLYSMFLHGGILHLGFNMLFFWIFANNVEARLGHLRFALFYLAAGTVSTVGYVIAEAGSALPLIGASGAIAGVMGAYLVLYPNVRIRAWMFFWVFNAKAKWFLIIWFLSQFYLNHNSQVAWVAHVTGFIFGVGVGIWARGRPAAPPPAGVAVSPVRPAW